MACVSLTNTAIAYLRSKGRKYNNVCVAVHVAPRLDTRGKASRVLPIVASKRRVFKPCRRDVYSACVAVHAALQLGTRGVVSRARPMTTSRRRVFEAAQRDARIRRMSPHVGAAFHRAFQGDNRHHKHSQRFCNNVVDSFRYPNIDAVIIYINMNYNIQTSSHH